MIIFYRAPLVQAAAIFSIVLIFLITPGVQILTQGRLAAQRAEAASALNDLAALTPILTADAARSTLPAPASDAALGERITRCGAGEAGVDTDNDGLDDRTENCLGSDPYSDDTDQDGISDGGEVAGFDFAGKTWPSAETRMIT